LLTRRRTGFVRMCWLRASASLIQDQVQKKAHPKAQSKPESELAFATCSRFGHDRHRRRVSGMSKVASGVPDASSGINYMQTPRAAHPCRSCSIPGRSITRTSDQKRKRIQPWDTHSCRGHFRFPFTGSSGQQPPTRNPDSKLQPAGESENSSPHPPAIQIPPTHSATARSGTSAPGRCRCRLSW
jgi:hypothetical protein